MAGASTSEDAAVLKEQANAAFKEQQYLKAAALYTKAIKLDPENAVLYSNRSTSLLKLSKLGKALEDADAVIRLRPDWDKGYFRKAAVCEEQGDLEQALDLYQECLVKANQGSSGSGSGREVTIRIRALQKKLGRPMQPLPSDQSQSTASTARGPEPAATAGAAVGGGSAAGAGIDTERTDVAHAPGATSATATGAGIASASTDKGKGPPPPPMASSADLENDLGSAEVAAFLQEHLEILAGDLHGGEQGEAGGLTTQAPTVHFLPGSPEESYEEHECHVRGTAAFDSPETHAGFVDFLRTVGQRVDAKAVLSVVPKSVVAFPKVWSKPGWPCGSGDGALLQLEVRQPKRLKRLFFFPYAASNAEQGQLHGLDPDAHGVLPSLLR